MNTPAWVAGAATDTGLLRERNEDRYWVDSDRGAFLVVDGLGGQAAGEVAAQIAVDEIRDALRDLPGAGEAQVRAAITRANNQIFEQASRNPSLAGMACVLTLALVEEDQITVGHVGDSRLYLFRNEAVRKLTRDHSPVGEKEDAGDLTEEEAMRHPHRNEVFRDVGSRIRDLEDQEFIEIGTYRFHPDAALLLCSDGVTDQLPSAEVRAIIERYDGDAARVASELVEAANLADGKDNATAIFVAGPEFPQRKSSATVSAADPVVRPAVRLLRSRPAFLCYGLLLGMILWAVLRAARG